jgi:hypothetical protein
MWLASWVLQVMPVFFYVGGSLHRRAYRPGFVGRRVAALVRMASPLLAAWVVIGAILTALGGLAWARETVAFAISPLWFLAVYLMLVGLLPGAMWLHRRLGLGALPLLGGVAVLVDVLRFGFGVPWVGWVNLVVVWALAHQAGFHHDRLTATPKRIGYGLVAAGTLGLTTLVVVAGYPGWLVGVSTEKWSNMSPPTAAIVALIVLQAGLIRLAYPVVARVLAAPAAGRVLRQVNRYGVPVYLFHLSALLLATVVGWPLALLALAGVVRRATTSARQTSGEVDQSVADGAFRTAARLVDQGAVHRHGRRAAAVEVHGIGESQRVGDGGRFVHGRADTGGLPAVDRRQDDRSVARLPGDGARVACEETACAVRHDDLTTAGQPVPSSDDRHAGMQR